MLSSFVLTFTKLPAAALSSRTTIIRKTYAQFSSDMVEGQPGPIIEDQVEVLARSPPKMMINR